MIHLPQILSEHWRGPNAFAVELALRPELDCFRGHFDGAPVLAGVVQVGWVFTLAKQKFERAWQFRGLQSVKFQRLVLPPLDLRLSIEYQEPRQLLKFRYSDSDGSYSSGGIQVMPQGD